MRTADTSVVVAACASWHEHHDLARRALSGVDRAVGHVITETYSVLTRLPDPHRMPASVAASFLAQTFPGPPIVLDGSSLTTLPERLAGVGIQGGATYDALVAVTAEAGGAELITLDERARPTYEALGVDHQPLIGA